MVTTAAPANVSRLESLRRTNTPARMRIAAGGTAILAIVMAFVGSTAFAAAGHDARGGTGLCRPTRPDRGDQDRHRRGRRPGLDQLPAGRARGTRGTRPLHRAHRRRPGPDRHDRPWWYRVRRHDARKGERLTGRATSPSSSSPAPTSARDSRSAPPISARHRAWSATRSSRSSMPSPPAAPNEPPRRSMTTRGRSWDCGSRPSRCSLRSWSDRSGCTGEPDGS